MSINLPKLFESGKHNILAVDPSGSHLSYVLAEMDLDKESIQIVKAGMLWTPASYDKGQRLRYMQAAIDVLICTPPYAQYIVDAVVSETFFTNPKLITGAASIIPTINNLMLMAASQEDIKYQELGPTTWRSILGIKGIKVDGRFDYKEPAKRYVEQYEKMPETIRSNVDGRMRKTPHDLTDALCIGLAVGKYHGCNNVSFLHTWDFPYGHLNRFAQIAKGK